MADDRAYWSDLRATARQTDPELALAQHLDRERQRLYRWYPYVESWRGSDAYAQACQTFEVEVVEVLAKELGEGDEQIGSS